MLGAPKTPKISPPTPTIRPVGVRRSFSFKPRVSRVFKSPVVKSSGTTPTLKKFLKGLGRSSTLKSTSTQTDPSKDFK